MFERNLRYPGIMLIMLEGMRGEQNWIERPWQNYEVQIMKGTRCGSYSEIKKLRQYREKQRAVEN